MPTSSDLSSQQRDAWQILELGPLVPGARNIPVAQGIEAPITASADFAGVTVLPIARQGWSELPASVKSCTLCGLSSSRRHALVAQGSQKASWMVLSEAPDENEDISGEAFAGPPGQLLDAIFRAVGLQRERDVYLTHVVKCRPAGGRDPLPTELASCQPYWRQEALLLRPSKIVVLGRFAAQAVLGSESPTASLRGRAHSIEVDAQTIPVVVTYHPSYLIRHPEHKNRAWQDWLLAKTI
jgi:uracil-DNA glycosylase